MDLVVGAGKLDRTLENAEGLADAYRTDDGLRYLDYVPLTSPGRLVPEDLAVTILINSRVAGTAFKAVQDHGDEVPLDALSDRALEDADDVERQAVCDVISTVVAKSHEDVERKRKAEQGRCDLHRRDGDDDAGRGEEPVKHPAQPGGGGRGARRHCCALQGSG